MRNANPNGKIEETIVSELHPKINERVDGLVLAIESSECSQAAATELARGKIFDD
jgi:hypothetical protein